MIRWDESPRISKKWLEKLLSLELDENLKFCIQKLAEAWLYFSQEIVNIEKKLSLLTPKEQELYEAYRKVPGIGSRIARTLVHELGDTMQFTNEEKLL